MKYEIEKSQYVLYLLKYAKKYSYLELHIDKVSKKYFFYNIRKNKIDIELNFDIEELFKYFLYWKIKKKCITNLSIFNINFMRIFIEENRIVIYYESHTLNRVIINI